MSNEMQSRVGRVFAEGQTDLFVRPVAPPKKDEVVIHIRASALCGSDLHIFRAKHPSVPLPATIGHEFSGDIVAIGSDVHDLSIGDRVTVEPCEACGTCDACRHGEYGSCESLSFIYRKGDGALADYITVKAASVFRLPDDISYETGALIEPLSVAVHAVRRTDVRLGESVLVLGAGAIGILAAALCRRSGRYNGYRVGLRRFPPGHGENNGRDPHGESGKRRGPGGGRAGGYRRQRRG